MRNKNNIASDFLVARPSALSGIARFFDFAGAFDAYNGSPTPEEADVNAIYADWSVVGDSIRSTACHLSAEHDVEEDISTADLAVSVEERIDAITKKHADSEGGGHYKASNGSWCCKHCRRINAALRELAESLVTKCNQ